MADTFLLLVRHGQTEWNRERRIQGNGNSPLTELGHAQAKAAAIALKQYGIDALYASDAGRVLQTSEPIILASGRNLSTDPRLRERHYGLFEGKTQPEIRQEFPDIYEEYRLRRPGFVAPGGESSVALQERGMAACNEIVSHHSGQTVAVVSHGGTIQAIARYVLDVPLTVQWRIRLENGGLTIIRHNDDFPDPWWMITLNEVGHLRALSD
jgi:probable phosphoglycerate mutase